MNEDERREGGNTGIVNNNVVKYYRRKNEIDVEMEESLPLFLDGKIEVNSSSLTILYELVP